MAITPRILYGPYGDSVLTAESIITLPLTATQDGHAEIAIGSWLIDEAVKGLRALKDGEGAAAYVVTKILQADGRTPKLNGYLTAAEAGSGLYKLAVVPIGGCVFAMEEDGSTANITDADLATKIYYDVNVSAVTDSGEAEKIGEGVAHANIKIKSDSGNAASTGLLVEILGVHGVESALANAPTYGAAYSTGKGRTFKARVVSTLATQTQA